MSQLAEREEQAADALTIEALKDAFERFSESSTRLEERYQLLMEETAILRESLRQKDVEIKRHERLSLLGETAAALAHEVRNPLGAIKLFLSLLGKEVDKKPEALALIGQINLSITTLDNVVSNILQFSKDRKLTFAPVNMNSLIKEQLLSFPRSDSNRVSVALNLVGNPFVLGNESALRQVLYNLILNAHQAMKYSGTIRIETRDEEDALAIIISDSGPGIPGEVSEKLFDPFVTTRNEGTGLGLAIVKRIVTQHNGSINVMSRNGAIFTIVIPRTQEGVK